jgi:hypothetical protein
VSESLNIPQGCTLEDVAYYGIEASRRVLRVGDVRQAQLALKGHYGGNAIEPLDEIPDLELLSPSESTSALVRAGIRVVGHTGMQAVLGALQSEVPSEVRTEIISNVNQFSVSAAADEQGERTISLRMSKDDRHGKHHRLLTDVINTATRTPYEWSAFRALLPIAKLRDASLAKDIRRRRMGVAVPLGTLYVRRAQV